MIDTLTADQLDDLRRRAARALEPDVLDALILLANEGADVIRVMGDSAPNRIKTAAELTKDIRDGVKPEAQPHTLGQKVWEAGYCGDPDEEEAAAWAI